MGNKRSKIKQKEDALKIEDKILKSNESENVIKILLLGTGNSGKSTFWRSLSYTHTTHNNIEPTDFTTEIRSLCCYSIHIIAEIAAKYNIIQSTSNFKRYIQTIKTINDNSIHNLNDSQLNTLAVNFNKIWNMEAIKQIFYEYRIKPNYWFALNENIDYFFNKINDIFNPKYIPNTQDILKSSIRTTGCYQQQCQDENGNKFSIWDVGGQRSEAKKWWHCFDTIHCVIFVCELSAYCRPQEWNEKQIQINECLDEWNNVSNSKFFKRCKMVLLLNKTDLFRKYLQFTPLTACFDEYKGKNYGDLPMESKMKVCQKLVGLIAKDVDIDINKISMDVIGIIQSICDIFFGYWLDLVYKEGIEFIKNKFLNIHSNTLVYEVCAIDMHNVKDIMSKIIQDVNFV